MDVVAGEVVSVNLSEVKGVVKRPVAGARLDAHGFIGDAHAGAWARQVSLLGVESYARFEQECGRAVVYGEFAENLTTRGIDLLATAVLDRFRIGEAELEVTQLGKKCHGAGCAIFSEVGKCVMPKEGIFCRVVRGGAAAPGDAIVFEPRPLRVRVITLSDRASRSEYDDLAGPRALELLRAHFAGRRWHAEFSSALLPDDAGLLRRELEAARGWRQDIVFTLGGTGIGPRDVTPEVVTSLADKLIPGIMESIRMKFGAAHPNALLSRSVAATLGGTLVYALPGSVRAVEEYLGEILKTAEHLVLMAHGIDAH